MERIEEVWISQLPGLLAIGFLSYRVSQLLGLSATGSRMIWISQLPGLLANGSLRYRVSQLLGLLGTGSLSYQGSQLPDFSATGFLSYRVSPPTRVSSPAGQIGFHHCGSGCVRQSSWAMNWWPSSWWKSGGVWSSSSRLDRVTRGFYNKIRSFVASFNNFFSCRWKTLFSSAIVLEIHSRRPCRYEAIEPCKKNKMKTMNLNESTSRLVPIHRHLLPVLLVSEAGFFPKCHGSWPSCP